MSRKPTKNGARERKEQAHYFLSLSLENVRCFGPRQTLDLSDGKGKPARWTLLLGNNGTGKTTVLQALVTVARNPSTLEAPRYFFASLSHNWLKGNAEASCEATVVDQFTFTHGGACVTDQSVWETSKIRDALEGLAGYFPSGPSIAAIFAFGTSRRMGASKADSEFLLYDDPVGTLFSDGVDLRNAEEWLLQLDYAASKHRNNNKARERFGLVKELLLRIMPEGEVEDIRCDAGSGTHPKPKVEFQTPYGWVPLRQLGYGYQTLIAWMVDLASRMVERYPDSPDPLAEPAVVLVDEIDLHLHPTWQRKLVSYLTERFPNTQFIATAHSPLTVQAAQDANFALLRREGDHVVIDNDVKPIRNASIDQILTSELFGLESARPPQIEEALAERKQLLTKTRLTEADKRRVAELEKQIGPLPGGETAEEAKEILKLTRDTQELLKSHRAQRSS